MKKVVAMLLVVSMAIAMVACGGKGGNGDSNVNKDYAGRKEIKIKLWRSGLGEEYLAKMIEEFNEKQTEYYATYETSSDSKAVLSAFGLADTDETDLYVAVGGDRDLKYMEPLDDVLDATADGDTKTIREKFFGGYLDIETCDDGHIYEVTGSGGLMAIVYNKKLFEQAGITQVPRTTDELMNVCATLRSENITPLINFNGGGYIIYYDQTWQVQYDGLDYWKNRWMACVDEQGNSPSLSVFTAKDGRYQTLKVLEQFLAPQNMVNGSNSMDHITSQTTFLNSDIGMMVTGSWLSNEMKSVGTLEDYDVMKAPVISAITDKLTTVKSDLLLRELIDAIDAVDNGTASIDDYRQGDNYVVEGTTISAADWKYVDDARNIITASYSGNTNFIPIYSDQKEGAKEFLKFYYSDEGMRIMAKYTKQTLPMTLSSGELDTTDWNSFEKNMYKLTMATKYFISDSIKSRHEIFSAGGASRYGDANYCSILSANNDKQRMTADETWEYVMERIDTLYDGWIENIK